MKRLLLISSAVGVLAAFGFADLGMAASKPAATGLTGVWLIDRQIFDNSAERRDIPLVPDAKAAALARRKIVDESDPLVGPGTRQCAPSGMPGMMTNEFATQVVEAPGRIVVINEDNPIARTISLTRKVHSTEQDPTYNGDSIGHWEGKTLVVETTNLNDKSAHIPGAVTIRGTVKITERFHLEKGGTVLFNDMTFENPAVLTKPWTLRYAYHRAPADTQLWEYVCEPLAPGWSERYANDPALKAALAAGARP